MFQLHHIGYLVKDIAASAASFADRFGYVIESEVIEDPRQTAQRSIPAAAGGGALAGTGNPHRNGEQVVQRLGTG